MRPYDGIRPFRMESGTLELLDQRRLPDEEVWVETSTVEDTARAIETLVVRGAPAIACAAALGFARAARDFPDDPDAFDRAAREGLARLSRTRPTAVNLFVALDRLAAVLDRVPRGDLGQRRRALHETAEAIVDEDLASCLAIGRHGAPLLPDEGAVITHCNAGALATAGHGTALGMIRSAVAAGKRLSVLADETRPVLQGARLTAWELTRDGIPTAVICDNMAAALMRTGEIQAAVVGADRIARNGDTANKIGTYALAVLCRYHGIPFYVAAPRTTIDRSLPDGSAIPIEHRDGREVSHLAGRRLAPADATVRNPAFDVTPAELITAIVTDRGVFAPGELAAGLRPGVPAEGS